MSAFELLKRRSLRPSSKGVRPELLVSTSLQKCATHNGPATYGHSRPNLGRGLFAKERRSSDGTLELGVGVAGISLRLRAPGTQGHRPPPVP
jgi:hypothetical protein